MSLGLFPYPRRKDLVVSKPIVPLAILVLFSGRVFSENGVSDEEIRLGQSCALTGPAQALGTNMRSGLITCFKEVNAAGGIKGRRIKLISKDDGYEPIRAIKNTRSLIEQEKVFLLIGEVGTPTSLAVVPMAEESQVPFFGPFTGAEFLRNPFKEYVVNVRASYYQEMEALCRYLIDLKGFSRIACFYQSDAYGWAGLTGLEIALQKRKLELIAKGAYERNSTAVKSALIRIRRAKPEAVVMVGAYKPCAAFIKIGKQSGMSDVTYCNISFVGTEALRDELGPAGEGCIISQVVEDPWDANSLLVDKYVKASKKFQPQAKINFVSLEGYMVGCVFCMVAERVQGQLTRQSFLKAVSDVGTFELGGVKLEYGPKDHQGSNRVLLTIIRDGQIKQLEVGQ